MEPISFFRALGEDVERRWRAVAYDEERFPGIALEALERNRPSDAVPADEVLRWAASGRQLPPQRNMRDMFGQPPIQVYDNQRFYIEVLHWLDGSTSIHEHGFNGAFHVLTGSSIHCLYDFSESHRYNLRLRLGALSLRDCELLCRGETREIRTGAATRHSVFHLERPSISVVVRTPWVPGAAPQYSYRQPGLAVDPSAPLASAERIVPALETLQAIGADDADLASLLGRALESLDAVARVGVIQRASLVLSPRVIELGLEGTRDDDPRLGDALLEMARHQLRERKIVALRRKLRTPEHRFFLALLLTFDRGDRILDFVRRRHPHVDARALLLSWIEQLGRLEDPECAGARVFDFDFSSSEMELVGELFGGVEHRIVLERLSERFDATSVESNAENVAYIRSQLRNSKLFGPLFR